MSEENTNKLFFTDDGFSAFVEQAKSYADTKNVFVAVQNQTTYQEVIDAVNSGRVVQARDENGILYNMAMVYDDETDGNCIFTQLGDGVAILMVNTSNTWVAQTMNLATEDEMLSHTSNTSNPHNVTLRQLGVTANASTLNSMDSRVGGIESTIDNAMQQIISAQLTDKESALSWNGELGDKHFIELMSDSDGSVTGLVHVTDEVPDFINIVNTGFVSLDGMLVVQDLGAQPLATQIEFSLSTSTGIHGSDNGEVLVVTEEVEIEGVTYKKGVYCMAQYAQYLNATLPLGYVSNLYIPTATFDDPEITKLQAELDSHGPHVPTPIATEENIDEATFLRHDNTWQKITVDTIGAVPNGAFEDHIDTTDHPPLHIPTAGQFHTKNTGVTLDEAKFLRHDNTWQKVTPSAIGAVSEEDFGKHGPHVPEKGNADDTMFLRSNNTWQKVTPADVGAVSTGTFDSHVGNATHITTDERTAWNTASDFATNHTTNHAQAGAEVNQNAFSNVVAGGVTIQAESKTDTLTISAGDGISISGDTNTDTVTVTNTGVRSVTIGGTNGTIKVNGTDVSVKGLGSAAYTASTAYEEAGNADRAAEAALEDAKEYTDEKIADLLDNDTEAVDSIMELAEAMKTNEDAISALNAVAAGKASSTHTHKVTHTPAGTVNDASVTPAGTVESGFSGSASEHDHTFTGTAGKATATYKPAGGVSSTFSGTQATISSSYTPAGTVASTFSGTEATISATYTPSGDVGSTFAGSEVTSGGPSATTEIYQITATGSLPSLTTSVANRCLTFTFGAGSVPTRAKVTMPTGTHTHKVTAAGTVTSTFTGKAGTATTKYTPAGNVTSTFTGTAGTATATYKPAGTVTSTFTGTQATIESDYEPEGTISKTSVTPSGTVTSTFTGTAGTHKHTFTGTQAELTTGQPQ